MKNGVRNLGKDEVAGGINAHDFECINLFGNAHGANFGGNVGAYFTGHDEAYDGGAELKQHTFAGGETHGVKRNPGTAEAEGRLNGDDATHENRNDGYNG